MITCHIITCSGSRLILWRPERCFGAWPAVTIECSGNIALENVRSYADAGADLISIGALTNSARAMNLSFQMQLTGG